MHSVIFITAKDRKEASKIAYALVNRRLAACVNIVNNIESVYRWQGKIESSLESLLIVKSKTVKIPQIIKAVKTLHSYELPEIIALKIAAGDGKYLEWINDSLR